MWYLIHIDEGIQYTAKTKKELMDVSGCHVCERYGKGNYTGYSTMDGYRRYVGSIYSSKKLAIKNGFDWAFENNQEEKEIS